MYRYVLENDLVDSVIVSLIKAKCHKGDTFFPELDKKWKISNVEDHNYFLILNYEKELAENDKNVFKESTLRSFYDQFPKKIYTFVHK